MTNAQILLSDRKFFLSLKSQGLSKSYVLNEIKL